MSRTAVKDGVLRLSLNGVDWTVVSGRENGFTGFNTNILGTSEDIAGGGFILTADTRHKEGTVDFGVNHNALTGSILWDANARRLWCEWSPLGMDSGMKYTRYKIFAEVTTTAAGGSIWTYGVAGTVEEMPVEGTH